MRLRKARNFEVHRGLDFRRGQCLATHRLEADFGRHHFHLGKSTTSSLNTRERRACLLT